MLRISPIQIVAALAAAGLALACVYYGSQARGTVAHIMSLPRAASAPPAPARAVEVSATASGVKVIPFGMAAPAAASASSR